MLQRTPYQEFQPDQQASSFLSTSYILDILKRRAWYFAIPFLLVLTIGIVITFAWPARYLSEGKILVQSQEIPSELVRPTVVALANERIQVIEQRIMTRDNLLAIAKKFNISMGWQGVVSGTEIITFIKERAKIKPLELKSQNKKQDAIAFTVGFEYERPEVAMKVANEFVTMILGEDVRSRTNFATETTRFLEREVKRLESQLNLLDVQLADLKQKRPALMIEAARQDSGKELAQLKALYLVKSATYSEEHPDLKSLKRQIEALEKPVVTSPPKATTGEAAANPATPPITAGPGLDMLENQRTSLKAELNSTTQKLAAARLGESLERGQHSERLEIIEQATLPQKPVSPNRPKIFGIVVAVALMFGGGLVFAAESLNPAIRRSTDLFAAIDSHLIVSIPYVATQKELRGKKVTTVSVIGVVTILLAAGLTAAYFLLPPMDILFDKVMMTLLR